jgi:casein kinase 1
MAVAIYINNKYRLIKQIGKGTFGEIFEGEEVGSLIRVAIKLEHTKHSSQLLRIEADIYRHIYSPGLGIPKLLWYGIQNDYNVLVLELLGPNLQKLISRFGPLSIKTVITLAIDITKSLEYFHSKGLIHRDIKPENFLIGKNKDSQIYIIDYGLCKMYVDKKGTHIPLKTEKSLVGSIRYCSINSHSGLELSRRDDMESLGYMVIYLLKGGLPWQYKKHSKENTHSCVHAEKTRCTTSSLTENLPKEIGTYINYVKSLSFTARPDYDYIRSLFYSIAQRMEIKLDNTFEWSSI